MIPRCRNLRSILHPIWVAVLLVCAASCDAVAENVVLHLRNGDRIAGFVVSEYTNRLVLSNSWAKELSIPLSEIGQREIIAAGTNQISSTNKLASLKAATPPVTPSLFKHWKGEAEIGLDLIYSTTDQRTYHGRVKLNYELPYRTEPKLFFRNAFDYSAEYGRTDKTKSSDRMGASDKSTFDIRKRWYAYNLAGIGYDRVRKIALQFEEGPGVGYHLFTLTNLTMNLESGANYQVQYQTDNTDTRDFFFRLAEDFNLKLSSRTTLTEKFEFFPREDLSEYRSRFESTLSYNLWRYVFLNFTLRDYYDTKPATGASANELQIRSALGVKF
jgi:hypothetical protein